MPRRRYLALVRGEVPYKNPLSRAFGLVLNRIRNGAADPDLFEVDRIAARLEISASTYRLIEAGLAPVPAHCILTLHEAFGFTWEPLTSVVTAIHVLERGSSSVAGTRRTLEDIGTVDPRLAWLGEMLKQVWTLQASGGDDVSVKRLLRESGIVDRLRAQLFAPPQRPANNETSLSAETTERGRRLIEQIERLPTPLAYAVLAFLEELKRWPLLTSDTADPC